MTLHDAAVVAVAGRSDRRFLAVALRILRGSATEEECAAYPPRAAGERLSAWLARCRAATRARNPLGADALDRAAAAELERAVRAGILPVPLGAPAFPSLLDAIPDPPALLWVRGTIGTLAGPAIALVGSRAATSHGLAMARQLGMDLALSGWTIVSGLARGIDGAAHDGCLQASGRTIAVLGSGVDRVYPPEHADLADRIVAAGGALVSELPPGTPPHPFHFPLRNRLISGLSRAVVVVEAPEKSGALITASRALEQGRDVLAVPGAASGGRNRGAHLLIRDGATLVESAVDILDELGQPGAGTAGDGGHAFEAVEFTADDLAAETGLPAEAVLATLLEWELSGRIQRIGGGRWTVTAKARAKVGCSASRPDRCQSRS